MTVYAGETLIAIDDKGRRLALQAGESCNVQGSFYNGDTAIAKVALASVKAWLYDEETGVSINSRKDQDILDANGGTIDADGVLTVRLEPADNVIVGTVEVDAIETHILRVKWTWNDGVAVRTGTQQVRLYIQQIQTVT